MRPVYMIDLFERGYLLSETNLLLAWWCGLGEDDLLQQLLLSCN